MPAVLGRNVAGAIAFPLGFLFFAVPIGDFLLPMSASLNQVTQAVESAYDARYAADHPQSLQTAQAIADF